MKKKQKNKNHAIRNFRWYGLIDTIHFIFSEHPVLLTQTFTNYVDTGKDK